MYFFIMCPQLVLQIEMTNVSRRCEVGRAEPRRSDCARHAPRTGVYASRGRVSTPTPPHSTSTESSGRCVRLCTPPRDHHPPAPWFYTPWFNRAADRKQTRAWTTGQPPHTALPRRVLVANTCTSSEAPISPRLIV